MSIKQSILLYWNDQTPEVSPQALVKTLHSQLKWGYQFFFWLISVSFILCKSISHGKGFFTAIIGIRIYRNDEQL